MITFNESDERIHSLVKRYIKLKDSVISNSIPQFKRKKAIRLWIDTIKSLKKAVKINYNEL